MAYQVPGKIVILDQNVVGTMACWATVYTMMKSWKDQASYDIRNAVKGYYLLQY